MGTFDRFADAPEAIKKEGQEITLKFTKTGATTGRISWNIPRPVAGCASGVQAYNGIVLTVANKAANYISTSPKDGTFYTGDNSADVDLHAGDLIDGALVLAALYDDKVTTYIDITDLQDRTVYYISGYAVDRQARYHREGVHAYSLPTGSEENTASDKAAYHDIAIDVVGGIQPSTATGLVADTEYTLKLLLDGIENSITLNGEDALTYADLVSELKEKLAVLGDVYSSPLSPHINELYYNAITQTLHQWDGSQSNSLNVLVHSEDPTTNTIGALWYNPITKVLKRFDGVDWLVSTYIETPFNPSAPSCNQTWFDGTNVWQYKLTHWEKLVTYIQTRNPLMSPLLSCDDYWYDTNELILGVWDAVNLKWNSVDAIYSTLDPSLLNTGDFWFDETVGKVKQFISAAWAVTSGVEYITTAPTGLDLGVTSPFGNIGTKTFVFVADTQKLYKINTTTLLWSEQVIVSFPLDPRNRALSKLWWNSTTDILRVWNDLANVWVIVTQFTQSAIDPSLPVEIAENSAWYNPDTGEVKLIFATSCKLIFPIINSQNPLAFTNNTVWHNTETNTWHKWVTTTFVQVYPLFATLNPYDVWAGYYWLDSDTDILKKWSGTAWVTQNYVESPIIIPVASYWFNTVNDTLFTWDGRAWVVSLGVVSVELIQPLTSADRSIISFFTRDVGCASSLVIVNEAGLLISQLGNTVIYYEAIGGQSGLVSGPMQRNLGVGDDGSPDERRTLHGDIRAILGHPVVQVELTKEQLDICINNALIELRKYSSYSYTRGFFFLDLRPNQQTYMMTNKCVGFNKIVGVNAIHRVKSGAFKSGGAFSNDVFAYGALQSLYTMGTFDLLSYHLMSSYLEEMETLFASRIMYSWKERERELGLQQIIGYNERVLIDAYIERSEQVLMTDRHTSGWLRRWATAEAKKMLSQSRGKFTALPGPNGSTTLNADSLANQAEGEMTELREQLYDGGMQDLVGVGLKAHFFIG